MLLKSLVQISGFCRAVEVFRRVWEDLKCSGGGGRGSDADLVAVVESAELWRFLVH